MPPIIKREVKMAGLLEGLEIVDAEEPMELHVLKMDINRRNKKDPAHCALAECVMRQYDKQDVRVYLSRAYVKEDDHWVRYEVSQLARREITAYDRGGSFMPGIYRLNVPSPSTRKMREDRASGKTRASAPRQYRAPRAIPQVTANIRPRSAVVANARIENARWSSSDKGSV
jgi:hypothetical protein